MNTRAILATPEKYLILDTETTGIDYNDEVIQLALVIPDATGTVVMDTLIQPTCPISPSAQQVHGISLADLQDAPTFWDIFPNLTASIAGKTLLIYNREFDEEKLRWTTARWALTGLPRVKRECVMDLYATFERGTYRCRRLPRCTTAAPPHGEHAYCT